MRRANRLEQKWTEPQSEECDSLSRETPIKKNAPPRRDDRESNRRQREKSGRVVGVTEPDQVQDQQQLPIRARSPTVVHPGQGEPRNDREEQQRYSVNLFVDDALVPHRESGSAYEGANERHG